MDINTFKILHSDMIMYYQIVENDLKLIYAQIFGEDINEAYAEVEKKPLGAIIKQLKEYDKSTEPQMISDNDYNFLKQMKDNRNFWAHENYIDFLYEKSPLDSEAYKKQCKRLEKDHERMHKVYKEIEALKIKCQNINNIL